MKQIMTMKLFSMTHVETTWFEISKGEKFYSPDEIREGTERICTVIMKDTPVHLYRATDEITVVHDNDGIGAMSMREYHGIPVLWSPRLFLVHNGREVDLANTFPNPKARRLCRDRGVQLVCMPGDFSPVWYRDEVLVPDYNMTGTGYYVCPADILEKCV